MRKGDIHRFRVPKALGHEQAGPRFGVIVQANELLPRSVVLVAPTSSGARAASFRPEVKVANAATKVLVEQLGAVDSWRLGEKVGHLSTEEMWLVDDALITVLGLP